MKINWKVPWESDCLKNIKITTAIIPTSLNMLSSARQLQKLKAFISVSLHIQVQAKLGKYANRNAHPWLAIAGYSTKPLTSTPNIMKPVYQILIESVMKRLENIRIFTFLANAFFSVPPMIQEYFLLEFIMNIFAPLNSLPKFPFRVYLLPQNVIIF